MDLIIKGGTVIDGARSPRHKADVGIQNDRIAAVGDLANAAADHVVDAAGKIVAPGFIDVHNHSDGWLIKAQHLTPKTLQGFTTEILMLDGISYAPVNEATASEWMFYLRALDGLRMDEYEGWQTLAEFMQTVEGRTCQNFAVHIPYANVRTMSCGFGRAAVDDFQMRQMQGEIRRGMEAGAVGVSTGLDYIVQCFATTDELAEACSAMADFDGLYVTHMRYKKGLLPALREAIDIARRAGVKLHVSHLKAAAGEQLDEVLSFVDQVARKEVDFSFDVYPYQPGSTMLSYLLPYEVWEDGPLAALSKLRDPKIQHRLEQGFDDYRLDLDHVLIAWVASKENSIHQGKSLSQYIEEMGLPVAKALCNLLIEERLAVLCVMDEGDDALIEPFLKHDLFMIGSDGIYHPDGVIHPRMYGSAGRLLGPCVRELKLFSLEDAVYKLSGFAAQRFGLVNRGVIREGAFADVVVFDAETVNDRATYQEPHQSTVGVEYVVVNGTPIIKDGAPLETLSSPLPGRALKYKNED